MILFTLEMMKVQRQRKNHWLPGVRNGGAWGHNCDDSEGTAREMPQCNGTVLYLDCGAGYMNTCMG